MLACTRFALFAVLLMGLVVATARPDNPKPPTNPAKASATLPDGVLAYASANVAELWDHKAFAPVREARGKLEFAWSVQSLVGLTPTEIDRLAVFWPRSSSNAPAVLVTGRKAIDPVAVVKTLTRPGTTEPKPVAGSKVLVAPGAEFAYVLAIDARTLLLAPKSVDPTAIEKLAVDLPGKVLAATKRHTLAIALDRKTIADLPLPFGGPLLDFQTASLTADLGEDSARATLTAVFPTSDKARDAAPILRAKFDELSGWAKEQEKKAEGSTAGTNAYPAPLLEWVSQTLKAAKVRADGAAVVATADMKLEEVVSRVMLAVPDAALAGRGPSAAENNLKQIMLAIHGHHDANGHCPGNSYDKDGKPLLSWRVHILPYIEQTALYNQFKLDEPWDSEHNKKWSQVVIRTYQVPGRPAGQPWETYYQSFIGPKDVKAEHRPWLVEGSSKGPQLTLVTDGLSNTIAVAEAARAVPWAKPDDLPYDGMLPLPKLGGPNGTFGVAFGDGSVRTFRRGQIDDTNMRRLISIADGNPVVIPGRR